MKKNDNKREEKRRVDKAILRAQEKERNLVGMELHDNVNQLLAAALLFLSAIKDKNGNTEQVDDYVERSREYILDAVREIRQISHHLAPVSAASTISVRELFTSLFKGVQEAQAIQVCLDIEEVEPELIDPEISQNIYRIVQELLTNIIRYAQATTIRFSL